MSSSYYPQNIAILRKIFPPLAEKMDKLKDDDGGLKIEAAASGAPTLLIQASQSPEGSLPGLYVHSKRDPEREAGRLVESAFAESPGGDGPALVLGFGLGYTAEALALKSGEKPIIIVEKRMEILKKALEARDLGAFLYRERLVFVFDCEGVSGALALFESTPGVFPLVIRNRVLTGLDEEWYTIVEENIKTWNSRANVNRATQRRFGKRWVRNLARNLEIAQDTPGISVFEGLLRERDIPVFLAAAGPTLDTASPILNEIYKRCLVVATDTSLRFIHSRGIESDFVVSVDPQYWNFRHLDRLPSQKTRLIAESAVYPPVLRHSFGGTFLCGSYFPLGRFIEDRLEPRGNLGAGGSVATSAWDFARFLGAKKVWIAGLDLSFPELKTHFRGALFEEMAHSGSGRFSTAETWNYRLLRDGQPFIAKRTGGGGVMTDKRLSLYAAWFEDRFGKYPEIKNLSLSTGGLALKGLETAAEEELLALPERRKELDILLTKIDEALNKGFRSEETAKLRAVRCKNALETLLNGLEELENLALDAANCAGNAAARNRLGHLGDQEWEKAQKKLDTANKFIMESAVKEVAGFLFPETGDWEAEISNKTQDPLTGHLEFSSRFYKALAEAAGYNLQILSKVSK
jgi:hypothetical protein